MANDDLFSDPLFQLEPYSFQPAPEPDYLSWDPDSINPIESNAFEFLSQQEVGIAKVEAIMEPDFPKTQPEDNCVDLKVSLNEASVWKESQEFVNFLLGDAQTVSHPGVRLDGDLFVVSNRESQPFLYPVRMLSMSSNFRVDHAFRQRCPEHATAELRHVSLARRFRTA